MIIEKTAEEKTDSNLNQRISVPSQISFNPRLRLMDFATFAYIGLVALLLIFFHEGVQHWPWLVLLHVVIIGALMLFINYVEKKSFSKVLIFFRDAYPFFLYIFMFEELHLIANILFPFWLEGKLIQWDLFLFGQYPTVWVQSLFRPWLTEYMAFSYWSYYVIFPTVGVVLYLRKNKALYHSYAFHLSFTFYLCYFLYLFLSARGPHETLAHLHLVRTTAGFFDNLVLTIQGQASVSGAAFPSSHVAAVWVAWIFVFKYKRTAGWILLPLVISLSISVVYMQYHYAVDSIAGILLVLMTYPLARILEKKFPKKMAPPL
ncbi:MAG: phosphatase PAP2 family protein [bacterium]